MTFKYDPFGRRIYKSSSAGTSVYAYDDDGNLVEEANTAGTALARYTQGLNIDEPLAMLRSGTTSPSEWRGRAGTDLHIRFLWQTDRFDWFADQSIPVHSP